MIGSSYQRSGNNTDRCTPVGFSWEEAKIGNLYTPEAYEMFKRLEFKNSVTSFEAEDREQDRIWKLSMIWGKRRSLWRKRGTKGGRSRCWYRGKGRFWGLLWLFREKMLVYSGGGICKRNILGKSRRDLFEKELRVGTPVMKSFERKWISTAQRDF